ncbi:MAG TPA: DUF5327 family protein [Lentibacillus sp.]|nr:DUF5327 family protein [Lentibacillus sp.]
MMAVATDTILNKMKRELTEAQQMSADEAAMKKHIANIQLLCELLLEEQSAPGTERDMTACEMKAMMGDKAEAAVHEPKSKHDTIDHDGANGASIFDF